MYSEYCNNHPYAVNELNLLQHDQQYVLFFEVSQFDIHYMFGSALF